MDTVEETKITEVKQELPPKIYTPKEFEDAYNELCKKMGYIFSISPGFKLRDDGTFSVIITPQIVKRPE